MSRNGNRGYGKEIAQAVKAQVDDPAMEPATRSKSWLSSWVEPVPVRHRAREWLSMWLKADLKDIPPHVVMRYLSEMVDDVRTLGSDDAVDRFIDKILPKLLSNEPPSDE